MTTQCVGPEIQHTLEGLVNAHAFQGMVPSGLELERLDAKPDHVEMGYDDDAGPAVTVMLSLPGTAGSASPLLEQGPHFEHRIVDARGRASGADRAMMLRAAMVVDRAVPETALECQSAAAPGRHAFGVRTGTIEVALLIAALVLGVGWRLRMRRSKTAPPAP